MRDLDQWLDELGLPQYAPEFARNDIDLHTIPLLTDADLRELGLSLGHRRRLLAAAAKLGDGTRPGAPAEIAAGPEADPAEPAAWSRTPGERKPVTMLFADIVGSTALTERLDAEETHALLYGAIQRMCEIVERNGGTVCRFMGDGIMAMFGAPVANEHHALRACQAALQMQQDVADYSAALRSRHGGGVRIRVGMHSGEVVVLTVGDPDRPEYDASGPTVPLAARMEQAASPGTILLSEATRRLAADGIDVAPMDPVRVKGFPRPVPVFALKAVRAPDAAATAARATPFVGRKGELRQFEGVVAACQETGRGQVVRVRGEAGIGKSRLVEEYAAVARARGMAVHTSLVLDFGIGQGRDAVRSLVRALLCVSPESDPQHRAQAIDAAIAEGLTTDDQRVYLNDLLDLPQSIEEQSLYNAMDNATRNRGKQTLLGNLLRRVSAQKPVMAVIEDVHWANAATLPYLAALAAATGEAPALLVMTTRVEGDPLDHVWRSSTGGATVMTVDLGRLRNDEAEALASGLAHGDASWLERCVARAEGNPLFLEQLVRATEETAGDAVPDSIQSLVLARLDRLAARDKEALQAASVIGQRFSEDALRYLLQVDDYDCGDLIGAQLVRPEGQEYLFAHALIRDGVYSSLLKDNRRALHRRAAEWFADNDAELRAEHLARAEDDAAPKAYLEAARQQAAQHRYDRALRLSDRGLALAGDGPARFALTCLRGELLRNLGETTSSIDVFRAALQAAADETEACTARIGLAEGLRISTDYEEALAVLEPAADIARRHGRTLDLARIHHLRGNLNFPLGNIEECLEQHRLSYEHAMQTDSVEAQAEALGGLGDAEYARGRMRTSEKLLRECVEKARAHGLGRIEVANHAQVAIARLYTGDWQGARKTALAAAEAAARVVHLRAEMNARSILCHLLHDLGETEASEASIERAMELARLLGARNWEPMFKVERASLLARQGRRREAGALLDEVIASLNPASLGFVGGIVFGARAALAEDAETRAAALQKGEGILQAGSLAHGHLWFYHDAIDAMLESEDWAGAERYADALEAFTRAEPLGWSDFFIARGRALAKFGRGDSSDATLAELKRLQQLARRHGLRLPAQAIDAALAAFAL